MKKGPKILLYLSLSLNLIIILLAIVVKIYGVQILINARANIQQYVTGKKMILFLGDSISEQTNWDDLSNNAITINYAKGGNTTDLISNTLKTNYVDKADKIILMAGVNDLGAGKTPEETIKSYSALLKKLSNSRKKIVIESVLPINEGMKNFNYPNYKTTSKNIVKLNSLLKTLCSNEHIQYVDVYPSMQKVKDQLNPNYTFDGVHLNTNGYKVWKSVLRAQIVDLR